MPDALPAVTVPFSFANTGFNLEKSSAVAFMRACSSVSNTTSPFFDGIVIGRIWSLK